MIVKLYLITVPCCCWQVSDSNKTILLVGTADHVFSVFQNKVRLFVFSVREQEICSSWALTFSLKQTCSLFYFCWSTIWQNKDHRASVLSNMSVLCSQWSDKKIVILSSFLLGTSFFLHVTKIFYAAATFQSKQNCKDFPKVLSVWSDCVGLRSLDSYNNNWKPLHSQSILE